MIKEYLKLLKDRGLTYYDIADICGVSRQTVYCWERGMFNINDRCLAMVIKLVEALRKKDTKNRGQALGVAYSIFY